MNFPDEIERENYMAAVRDKYNIGYESLKKLVAANAMKTGAGMEVRPIADNRTRCLRRV